MTVPIEAMRSPQERFAESMAAPRPGSPSQRPARGDASPGSTAPRPPWCGAQLGHYPHLATIAAHRGGPRGPEEGLAQHLPLIRLPPELLDRVVGREDRAGPCRYRCRCRSWRRRYPGLKACARAASARTSVRCVALMRTVLTPLPRVARPDRGGRELADPVRSGPRHRVRHPFGTIREADDLMVTGSSLDLLDRSRCCAK